MNVSPLPLHGPCDMRKPDLFIDKPMMDSDEQFGEQSNNQQLIILASFFIKQMIIKLLLSISQFPNFREMTNDGNMMNYEPGSEKRRRSVFD